jgi:hypothetical protein
MFAKPTCVNSVKLTNQDQTTLNISVVDALSATGKEPVQDGFFWNFLLSSAQLIEHG